MKRVRGAMLRVGAAPTIAMIRTLFVVALLFGTTPQGWRLTYEGPADLNPALVYAMRQMQPTNALVTAADSRIDARTWHTFVLDAPDTASWPAGQTVFVNTRDGEATIAVDQLAVATDGRAIRLGRQRAPLAHARRRRLEDGTEGVIILVAFPRDLSRTGIERVRVGMLQR